MRYRNIYGVCLTRIAAYITIVAKTKASGITIYGPAVHAAALQFFPMSPYVELLENNCMAKADLLKPLALINKRLRYT